MPIIYSIYVISTYMSYISQAICGYVCVLYSHIYDPNCSIYATYMPHICPYRFFPCGITSSGLTGGRVEYSRARQATYKHAALRLGLTLIFRPCRSPVGPRRGICRSHTNNTVILDLRWCTCTWRHQRLAQEHTIAVEPGAPWRCLRRRGRQGKPSK